MKWNPAQRDRPSPSTAVSMQRKYNLDTFIISCDYVECRSVASATTAPEYSQCQLMIAMTTENERRRTEHNNNNELKMAKKRIPPHEWWRWGFGFHEPTSLDFTETWSGYGAVVDAAIRRRCQYLCLLRKMSELHNHDDSNNGICQQ